MFSIFTIFRWTRMDNKLYFRLTVLCLSIMIPGCFSQVNIIAVVDTNVTLDCYTSTIEYPQWKGPGDVLYNYAGLPGFNMNTNQSARLRWNNDKMSLILMNITRIDAGNYSCFYQSITKQHLLKVRVPPTLLHISNAEIIDPNRTVIRVNEDTKVTLECTCSGGYPESKVEWFYKDLLTTPLPSNTTTTLNKETYTIVANHTFIAKRSDDMKEFVCLSRFDTKPVLIASTEVELYLQLKPNNISVETTTVTTEGENSSIAICVATGFRPENGVNASWVFQNTSIYAKISIGYDSITETFAVTTIFTYNLSRDDNGSPLVCKMNHILLEEPLSSATKVSVKFPPKYVTVSGNVSVIANTFNKIVLNCTTDSSQPASNISWIHSNAVTLITGPQLVMEGQHNGMVTSQLITVIPTRDMDAEIIKCEATNPVIDSPVSTETKLDISYHPVVNVSISSLIAQEGQSNIVFLCTANSKPRPRFVWLHYKEIVSESDMDDELDSFEYKIDNITRNQTGEYTCEASNDIAPNGREATNVTVEFAPNFATLSGKTHVTANGIDNVTLICETDSANPESHITWKMNNTVYLNTTTYFNREGEYGGFITSEKLDVLALRNMDNAYITCFASNVLTPNNYVNTTVVLNIKYEPDIHLPNLTESTVEEIGDITLACEVKSNPVSTITWSKDNETLEFGTTYNVLQYTIFNITRFDRGPYACSASNGIGQFQVQEINITVQYAPDVTATAQNVSVDDNQLEVLCSPMGVPNIYTFSNWTQVWPGYGVVSDAQSLGNQQRLVLTDLTYQHSGIYQCTATNGIYSSINQNTGRGEVYVSVKSRPIVITPNTTEEKRLNVAVKLNTVTYIGINIFSNTLNLTGTCCEKNPNDYISIAKFSSVTFVSSRINLPVFGHIINTDGYLAEVNVTVSTRNEFGNYVLTFSNEIGVTTKMFTIVERGPPAIPEEFVISDVSHNSAVASWKPGFNGGDAQTFIIQIRTNLTWVNYTKVIDTGELTLRETIVDITPFTAYYARIFATNENGASEGFSNVANFITLHAPEGPPLQSNLNIGPILGALFGGIFITGVVVIIVVILYRNKTCPSGHTCSQNGEDSSDNMIDNHLYDKIDEPATPTRQQTLARSTSPINRSYEKLRLENQTDPDYSSVQPEPIVGKLKKSKRKQEPISVIIEDKTTYDNLVLNPKDPQQPLPLQRTEEDVMTETPAAPSLPQQSPTVTTTL